MSTRSTGQLALGLMLSLSLSTSTSWASTADDPVSGDHRTARLVIAQPGQETVVLGVRGERMREDGRLRFAGSFDRPDGGSLVRWNLLCDPNPNGEASIEGVYELVGPFEGSVRLELPLNPVVDGPIALKTHAVMRAQRDGRGTAIAIPSGEHAWGVTVDGRLAVKDGAGPLRVERRSAGVTEPRTWSNGELPHEDPVIFARARDHLGLRVACILEAGASAVFTGRVRMVGDSTDFRYRDDLESEQPDSVIPRRSGSISIVVPGTGGRGRQGRPNKQPAVVRPSRPKRDSEG